MRRKIPLSSLSVGRCFVHQAEGADLVGAIVQAASAWRITETGDGDLMAECAEGTTQRFPSDLLVAEIPREGYIRLQQVHRARIEEAD